jgi:hypothetical protein
MNDPSDESHINPPSHSTTRVGRYDKLQEGGKATRFIKGGSGNFDFGLGDFWAFRPQSGMLGDAGSASRT